MNEQNDTFDDEISLTDIYSFLKDGWKTIAATTLLGGVIGVGVALVLPEKFIASGVIQPARVLGKEIEPVNVLAEKMRSPTYYSYQTLEACGLTEDSDPADKLTKELEPTVAKKSVFVSVTYKSASTEASIDCLNAVLDDVNLNQSVATIALIKKANQDLSLARQLLESTKTRQQQELKQNKQKLKISKQKLIVAQKFIDKFAANSTQFSFGDEKFSASSLLLATILEKQAEVKDLQLTINELEMKVQSASTDYEKQVLDMEKQVLAFEAQLLPPATDSAKFATPIHAPEMKVEPKRSLISIISILLGGLIGTLILFVKKAIEHR